ncbi:LysE/ArgO family amino acid transporter [Heyndrickxia acidicola]|uniref:LysE/ArgO family amino acid transporter n=1 Tax=Heyndrickxia acidicola TaxID=209389 RepID=UPI000AAFB932|nr:LysE family transporter [Heyndrickxia acidicola]
MILSVIIHGVILSIGLILPLGAQNTFIFQQGICQKRFKDILPAILTASLSDTLLIIISVTGFSVLVLASHWIMFLLMSTGVLFLIYMGALAWRANTGKQQDVMKKYSYKKQILYAASVSILNPHALLDTAGVIRTNSIEHIGILKYIFTLSCIFISWSWFFLLAFLGRSLGRVGNSESFLRLLNKISAVIMWGVAVYLFLLLLKLS